MQTICDRLKPSGESRRCTSSMQLYREVFALGFTGGCHVVNRYVAAMRKVSRSPSGQ